MGLKGSVGGVENPESPDRAVGRAAMEGQERAGVENPESPDGAVGRAAMEGQERAGLRTPRARTEQRTS